MDGFSFTEFTSKNVNMLNPIAVQTVTYISMKGRNYT